MSRVLLTGAAGFLGAHCLRDLVRNTDAHVVCPVSFRHRGVPERISWALDPQTVPNEAAITGDLRLGAPGGYVLPGFWDRVTVFPWDLSAPMAWTTREIVGDCDLILNFASLTHPPGSVVDPEGFIRNNVELMLSLLDYCRAGPWRRFVHLSTDAVYGSAEEGPHREWAPIRPENPYAASKAAQEAILHAYAQSYGVPALILTTANPVGETQDPEKFVPKALARLLAGAEIQLHVDEDGRYSRRAYIDVNEVVRGVSHFTAQEMTPGTVARFNLAGRRELTPLDVVDALASALSVAPRIARVESPAGYGMRYALDGSEAARHGFTPRDNIIHALRRIALWTRGAPLWISN